MRSVEDLEGRGGGGIAEQSFCVTDFGAVAVMAFF